MKAMADEKKQGNASGGGKTVAPAAEPRVGLFQRLMKAPEFFAEVRQEAARVTWPTIDETRVTTIAVFFMIIFAVIFFAAVDFVISTVVKWVLG